MNNVFQEFNIKGWGKEKIIQKISFARENLENLKFYKESNFKDFQNLFSLQIYLAFYDMQEAFKFPIFVWHLHLIDMMLLT